MMPTPSDLQPLDLLEQQLGFLAAECRRRLVEDQQPGVERQRLGDLDQLLLRRSTGLRRAGRARCRGPAAAGRLRALFHGLAVDRARPSSDSGRRRHSRRSTASAAASAPGGSCRRPRPSRRGDWPGRRSRPSQVISPADGLNGAGNDVRQGRFSGTVFTKQRHDFARVDVEIDTVQHLDRTVGFLDPTKRQDGSAGWSWRCCLSLSRRITGGSCTNSGAFSQVVRTAFGVWRSSTFWPAATAMAPIDSQDAHLLRALGRRRDERAFALGQIFERRRRRRHSRR